MDLFPTLNLIRQPDNAELREQVGQPGTEKDVLILYDGDLPFLERVLNAAGYDDPPNQLYLLRREPGDPAVDLSALLRPLAVTKVMLFGQHLPELGLHFSIAKYAPVTIGGYQYMVGDSVAAIASAKAQGDNATSRALWEAIKAAYLRK